MSAVNAATRSAAKSTKTPAKGKGKGNGTGLKGGKRRATTGSSSDEEDGCAAEAPAMPPHRRSDDDDEDGAAATADTSGTETSDDEVAQPLVEIRRTHRGKKKSKQSTKMPYWEMHRRLGHPSRRKTIATARHWGITLTDVPTAARAGCAACAYAKAHRVPIPKTTERKRNPSVGHLIYSDVKGPLTLSQKGYAYLIGFIDYKSRYVMVYPMKKKTETTQCLHRFVRAMINRMQLRGRCTLFTDNGTEYRNEQFAAACVSYGIDREYSPPYTPEANAVIERVWRTLDNKVQAMLYEQGLPYKDFWPFAYMYAASLYNLTVHKSIGRSPEQLVWGIRSMDIQQCHEFGQKATAIVNKKKTDSRHVREGHSRYMGYIRNAQSHVVYNSKTRQMLYTPSVNLERSVRRPKSGGGEAESVPDTPPISAHKYLTLADTQEEDELLEEQPREDDEEYEIESIQGHETIDGKLLFDIKWKGYEETSWVPLEDLANAQALLKAYLKKHPEIKVVQFPVNAVQQQPRDEYREWVRQNSPAYSIYAVTKGEDYISTQEEAEQWLKQLEELRAPVHYKDIKGRPDQQRWMAAVHTEMENLHSNGTFEIVKKTQVEDKATVMKSHFIFTAKEENGMPVRAKARLVANGDRQTRAAKRQKRQEAKQMAQVRDRSQELDVQVEQGKGIAEFYSPVISKDALRLGIAHAVQESLFMSSIDVKAAFLHAEMTEGDPNIYLEIPQDMEPDHIRKDHYYKLKKSLYGLCQAPKMWFEHLRKILTNKMEFVQSMTDPCIFKRTSIEGQRVFAYVYVDDIVITADRQEDITWFSTKLHEEGCETTGGEEIGTVLGINICYDKANGKCSLNQEGYCKQLAREYAEDLQLLRRVSCKAPLNNDHKKLVQVQDASSTRRYRSVVGSLQYLVAGTRPDLAYAVSFLSRFLTAYDEAHYRAALHVLKYAVEVTPTTGISYQRQEESQAHVLIGYVDAGFVGDIHDSKCQHGYMMMYNGGPITWKSSKQPVVAMSTAEAEYIAAAYAAKEIVCLRQMLSDLECPQVQPTRLNEDNQAAIAIALASGQSQRTKHILRPFHYIRECVLDRVIKMNYCDTKRQLADMLTKILNIKDLTRLMNIMRFGKETPDDD